jgi:hypothetical protein
MCAISRLVLGVLTVAAAAPNAFALDFPSAAKIAPACVARVNKAALRAMNRTNPLGQMQIYGPPMVFNPHLLRVEINVFGARTEVYAVDLAIDDACNVLSASTRLETNDWNLR